MPPTSSRELGRVPTLAALVLAACLAPGCSPGDASDEAAAQAPNPTAVQDREIPKVRTEPVRRMDVERVLETTAPVESVSEIDVVAEALGRVIEVLAQEGEGITKGAVLARLEDRDQRIAVAEAEVALAEAESALESSAIAEREAAARTRSAKLAFDQAQRDLDRNLELAKSEKVNPLSVQAVETSRLARDNADETLKQTALAEEKAAVDTKSLESAKLRAELVLERAQRDLERTVITAPIDGVVARRSIEPGRNLTVGQVAFQLADLENLRVIFSRPQRELDLFTANEALRVTATSEARPGFRFAGEIKRTSPIIDRASGSFRVTANLEPASQPNAAGRRARLLPGMLLRLYVVTGVHTDTLVVPKRAVRREGASVFVLAVRDGKVHRIPVREEFTTDEDVEVIPTDPALPLAEDDIVIVVGSRELEDGDRVAVEGLTPAAEPEPAAPDAETQTEAATTASDDV